MPGVVKRSHCEGPAFCVNRKAFALHWSKEHHWVMKLPQHLETMLFDTRPKTFAPMRSGRMVRSYLKIEGLDEDELADLLKDAWRTVAPGRDAPRRCNNEEEDMIIGAHVMVQSTNDAADKEFFRDVLRLPNVDAGGGFLLFGVPPAEIAVHEGAGGAHELFLMCEDIDVFLSDMKTRGIAHTSAQNLSWGILSQITLPGGGRLGVYQPLHKRPASMSVNRPRKTAKPPARKTKPRKAKAKAKRRAKRR